LKLKPHYPHKKTYNTTSVPKTTNTNNPTPNTINQPKGSWVDKVIVSNSTTQSKIASFPIQAIGIILKS